MTQTKDNSKVRIEKDSKKSYVYIYDKDKSIGFLGWHYTKKKWMFYR